MWSLVLTLTAVLGTLCLLGTLVAPLLGIRPLIFTSGSMSPAIPAGSLALAKTTGADDLQVGDIVTVPLNGNYVTHRIVEITHGPGRATLLLRGDGNKVNDAAAYPVTEVPRTFVSVPRLGTFVAWFSHAPGVYVLAAWVALVLGTLRRGAPEAPPKPERVAGSGRPVLGGLVPAARRLSPANLSAGFRVPRRRGLLPVQAFLGVVLAAPWLAPTPTLASDVETQDTAAQLAAPLHQAPSVEPASPRTPLAWCQDTGHREVTVRWAPVADATSYRLVLEDHGRTTVQVPASTTTKTFRDRAAGTVTVKAVSATGLWVSDASNPVSYRVTGKASCG
jgi:signal peptidase I